MRKLLISVAIATATIAAVPAAAQYHGAGHGRPGWNQGGPSRAAIQNLVQDLRQAENRIVRSQQRRIISPREAVSLRREAMQIRQRLHFAGRGGISGREFAELRVRVNRLEQRIRLERRDRDRRAF